MSDAETVQKQRLKTLNAKGMEFAGALERVMSGKDVRLSDFELQALTDGGMRKEDRLRAFLTQINAGRKRLQAGGPFECGTCGAAFKDSELNERPWIAIHDACR